ncbi:hypothetical protein [Chromobacterium subtsugae]|uniref:hypothetical protein n=1 Tax=Chromobacterium subtsugae TaxID=251747 RepID=UPI000A870700|nr:hypothetical protein [Chromobacterium subtsugae]
MGVFLYSTGRKLYEQSSFYSNKWIVPLFSDDKLFRRNCILLVFALFIWCLLLSPFQSSKEAIISASRLLVETSLVFALIKFQPKNTPRWCFKFIIWLGTINGIIIVFQIMEGLNYLDIGFSKIITDVWKLPVNEYSRKPGLFSGFQSSSYISFMAIVLLIQYEKSKTGIFGAINFFTIFFGARTFLVFLPAFALINRRILAYFIFINIALLGTTNILDSHAYVKMMVSHLKTRVFPAMDAVYTLRPGISESASDTFTQYQITPQDINKKSEAVENTIAAGNKFSYKQLLLGNGMPRYSKEGGLDTMLSRWLKQSGAPAAILVSLLTLLICLKIGSKKGLVNKVLMLALLLSSVKGELVTATLIFSSLLIYSLTDFDLQKNY